MDDNFDNTSVNYYVPYVPDKSGINRITKNGKSIIFEENTTDLSKEQYLDRYCYLRDDGFYYYNPPIKK